MKKILSTAFILLATLQLNAQQDAMYTHYAYNTMSVNPAYAGNRGMFSTTLLHRSQWVGFDGAPMSQSLILSTPLLNNTIAIGASFQNDHIGPANVFSGAVDFAYKLKINTKSRLSFGMSGSLNNYSRNLSQLAVHDLNDYAINNNVVNANILDFGAGLLYTNKQFYIGASCPRILNTHFTSVSSANTLATKEKQHFYVTAGTAFNISKSVVCRPSTYIKMVEGVLPQADLTAMFVFNKKFELGAMFRTTDAAGILVGYSINKSFHVGYSFDWSYGLKTFQYNFGSHELMLRYDLFKRSGDDIISPRYF